MFVDLYGFAGMCTCMCSCLFACLCVCMFVCLCFCVFVCIYIMYVCVCGMYIINVQNTSGLVGCIYVCICV